MICILTLVVAGILGIFSVSHRRLAKEAFDCVFRRLTLRKCQTSLDERIKGKITAKLMKRSSWLAGFVDNHFEIFSWMLTLLLIVSLGYTVFGGINFYLYGNCNGPNEDGFCVFDPTGANTGMSTVADSCGDPELMRASLSIDQFDESLFPKIDRGSSVTVIEIGCYGCPYTQDLEPVIERLIDKYDVNFVFAHLPLKTDPEMNKELHCINELNPEGFWQYHDALFVSGGDMSALGFSEEDKQQCSDLETEAFVNEQIENIKTTNVYGTPTVFIKGPESTEVVVGPKPYRVYSRLVKKALKE